MKKGKTKPEKLTLSVKETALRLGVSLNNAYALISRGKLPSVRLGGRLLVPYKELEQMLATSSFTKKVAS